MLRKWYVSGKGYKKHSNSNTAKCIGIGEKTTTIGKENLENQSEL